MSETYDVTLSSRRIGICFSTSAAASRPSFTSSCGLYLFFGGVICVCALTRLTDSATIAATAWARNTRIFALLLDHFHQALHAPLRRIMRNPCRSLSKNLIYLFHLITQ